MNNSRHSVWILYIGCVLAILFTSNWIATAGAWVLGIIAVAHLVEFFVKRDVLVKAGGSMGHHFVQTMIYGLLYWKPLEEQQNSDS
ncbi:MAG: hypothetical protein VCC04_07210 [Myxococcota bacterium]